MKIKSLLSEQIKLYPLFLVLILIWGISWPVNKIGLEFMSPIWYAAFRLIFATRCMFIITFLIGKLIMPTKKDLPLILAIGLLQMCTFVLLINLGLYYVGAGLSAVLVYTTAIWIIPISTLFFKEHLHFLKWLGFIFGMVGILILFSPEQVQWSHAKVLIGYGILLLAALNWAFAILCARYMHWHHTPLELLPWQLLVGTIPMIIIALIVEPHPIINWNIKLINSLIYMGIVATAFANWGTIFVSKELPSILVSIGFTAVPVCGIIAAYFIMHEAITWPIMLAMIFIILGIICASIQTEHSSK